MQDLSSILISVRFLTLGNYTAGWWQGPGTSCVPPAFCFMPFPPTSHDSMYLESQKWWMRPIRGRIGQIWTHFYLNLLSSFWLWVNCDILFRAPYMVACQPFTTSWRGSREAWHLTVKPPPTSLEALAGGPRLRLGQALAGQVSGQQKMIHFCCAFEENRSIIGF